MGDVISIDEFQRSKEIKASVIERIISGTICIGVTVQYPLHHIGAKCLDKIIEKEKDKPFGTQVYLPIFKDLIRESYRLAVSGKYQSSNCH